MKTTASEHRSFMPVPDRPEPRQTTIDGVRHTEYPVLFGIAVVDGSRVDARMEWAFESDLLERMPDVDAYLRVPFEVRGYTPWRMSEGDPLVVERKDRP